MEIICGEKASPAVVRSTKSAVERTEDGRKEACRQAIMILQHENMRPDASELGFHGAAYSDFSRKRQFES
jgi:hypothetical protein